MANVAALDLDMSAVDFRAAHAEMVRLKRDRNGDRPATDAWRKVIALWGNWVDDTCLALQARSQDHEERIVELETGGNVVAAIQEGPGIFVDATDPANPVVGSTLFTAQASDDGGLTESLEGLLFQDADGFTVTNLGPNTARVGLSARTVVRSGLILDRETTDFDTAGSASAQAVFSYTVPGGTLSNGDILRLTIDGHVSNNDNGNIRGFTYRFNFGGVTLYQPSVVHNFSGLTAFVRRPIRFVFELVVQSQTLQVLTGHMALAASSTPATGFGDYTTSTASVDQIIQGIDSTVNLSSDRLLEFTVQPSNSVATLHWVRRCAILERL